MTEANLRNRFTELVMATEEVAAVDLANGDGTVDIEVSGLREIPGAEYVDASVSSADGYVAKCESVSANTATITLYESAGSNAAMATVGDGTDVADVSLRARGV